MNRTEAASIVTGNRISWASMGGAWSGIVSDVSSYTSGETFIDVDVDGGGTECFRLHVGDDIDQIIEVEPNCMTCGDRGEYAYGLGSPRYTKRCEDCQAKEEA